MGKIGLGILALIQIFTGLSMFFSAKEEKLLGIRTLSKELSIYRYCLTSLWFSVSIIYILGIFNIEYYLAAVTLGIINITFEILSYWGNLKNKGLPKWYPLAGTLVMVIPLLFLILSLE